MWLNILPILIITDTTSINSDTGTNIGTDTSIHSSLVIMASVIWKAQKPATEFV